MYLASAGTISVVADRDTPVPGGTLGNFTGFNTGQVPFVNGTTIAFRAAFTSGSGIYTRINGTVRTTADSLTLIPNGTGTFSSPMGTNQIVSGNNLVFRGNGSSSQQGAYFRDLSVPSNPILRVTDKSQILPGTASTPITTVFEPTISGNDVYAIVTGGAGTVRVARYTWNGSNVTPVFAPSVVAKFGDTVPGLTATFSNFTGFVPSDAGHVAFIGSFNDGVARTGVFFHDGTTLRRMMDTTQTLDGKTISSFLLGPDAVAGDSVTFYASFTDGSRGTYVATVPEPGMVLAFGGIFGVVLRIRRSR